MNILYVYEKTIFLDLSEITSEQHAACDKSDIFQSKSVKYSYFLLFLELDEENKKFFKLNFTSENPGNLKLN